MTRSEVRFAVGAVTRADIPALCADLAELLHGTPGGIVVCEVTGTPAADVALVEALARLRLTARRHGRRLHVAGAGPELLTLTGLLGLTDVLFEPVLPQVGRETEEREQAGGVEEVVDARDPSV
ncbi:STAS domain-containing protein [Actinoplanes sp. NEAU-A12]|uniref:STAS domain-containing protein n=1 Tax=Actinoplanes sandaracinus TaxID=3045177 RepID=A0ABT6WJU5_9ACTN|nr:STAS domain-containing protein [Actinoplanes sandaracinus]MDI6099961.1 STAS domain-containing protein [Actinoplanes sandaracinus]